LPPLTRRMLLAEKPPGKRLDAEVVGRGTRRLPGRPHAATAGRGAQGVAQPLVAKGTPACIPSPLAPHCLPAAQSGRYVKGVRTGRPAGVGGAHHDQAAPIASVAWTAPEVSSRRYQLFALLVSPSLRSCAACVHHRAVAARTVPNRPSKAPRPKLAPHGPRASRTCPVGLLTLNDRVPYNRSMEMAQTASRLARTGDPPMATPTTSSYKPTIRFQGGTRYDV
jgi:hypothetical protein